MILSLYNVPRWMILFIDLIIVAASVFLGYLVRFNFNIPDEEMADFPIVLAIIAGVRLISFLVARTYAGIIRYTSTQDAVRITLVLFAGSLLFIAGNLVSYYGVNHKYLIPFSIIIFEFMACVFGMITFRILVKITYLELINPASEKSNVIIYGAGEAGAITKRTLDRDAGSKNKIVAFIDDDPRKQGKKLDGIDIYGLEKLDSLIVEHHVENVIIAIQKIKPERKQQVVDICLSKNTRVSVIPPVVRWINGQLSYNQIKNIRIEDLLERDVIRLDEENIKRDISGKTVLITGAAGSIGSELARQVAGYNPLKLILVDQAESALFELDLEFRENYSNLLFEIILADITNRIRMEGIFKDYRPEVVFHAAAYKHVPMMENHPREAIFTNILGTRNMADLAVENGVQKFIMISTDKAVNPTSVMGASKRIAEIYTQALNTTGQTKFITTRFGNVLGSNGSAVPLFKNQIEKGGPVTVTHPEVTRFFMTIPEACQLVLEAGSMGKGGEIFLFDMGKPVKILDLATKMISLAGLTPGKDIPIKFTGLRPGEKLYEELLNTKENVLPTHHPQIMIGKVMQQDFKEVDDQINRLLEQAQTEDDFAVVNLMKKLVPEYKSRNSVYERLDLE